MQLFFGGMYIMEEVPESNLENIAKVSDIDAGNVSNELVRIVNYSPPRKGLRNFFVDYLALPKDIPLEHFMFMYSAFCKVNEIKPTSTQKAAYVMKITDSYTGNLHKIPRRISITYGLTKFVIRPHCFEHYGDKYKTKKNRHFDADIYTRFVVCAGEKREVLEKSEKFAKAVEAYFNKLKYDAK